MDTCVLSVSKEEGRRRREKSEIQSHKVAHPVACPNLCSFSLFLSTCLSRATYTTMPGGRVLCTSLFLPYTIDFELARDKRSRYLTTTTPTSTTSPTLPTEAPASNVLREPNAPLNHHHHHQHNEPPPNLIASLKQKQRHETNDNNNNNALSSSSATTPLTKSSSIPSDDTRAMFDFKKPEKLVQPKSKAQREKDMKRPSPLMVQPVAPSHHHHHREQSLDSATLFDEAPWTVKPCIAGNIGLHNALVSVQGKEGDVLQDRKCMWIGTLGMSTDQLSNQTRGDIRSKMILEYDAYTVMPSDTEFEGHYDRYCKQVRSYLLKGYGVHHQRKGKRSLTLFC